MFVVALSERHGTIYATNDGEVRVLLCQDARGANIGRLELSVADRRRWKAQLEFTTF